MRWLPFLLMLTSLACQSQDRPAQAQVDSTAVVQDTVAADAPDPAEAMTDGGAVMLPAIRQRALLAQDSLWADALRIHYNAIVFDGHIDTPTLMLDKGYAFGERHRASTSHVDLPRMIDSGFDAAFFSIYVNARFGEGEEATQRAKNMIAELKRQVALYPDSIQMATSAEEVRRLARSGTKAALMGLEGGHALAGSPDVLHDLYEAGIRYVTLTHVNTNSWADASQSNPRHGGLNALGRQLVRRMNQLGILVDLSHTADSTFYDALSVSTAPVILSHSSVRALTPSVRNIDDAMLRALAHNGGVVMINFFDAMVNRHLDADVMAEAERRIRDSGQSMRNLWNVVYAVKRERGLPGGSIEDVLDHIDHAVQVAGIDHVALGSDFDGVFDLPAGLEDVTRLPYLTYGLLQRGYAEEDIYKILGGNTLRVLEQAERVARNDRLP